METQRLEIRDDRRGDDETREPFVVSRHDVPWRMFRSGVTDRVFVSHHVLIPVLAFARVVDRKLPVLRRIVDTREKALPLLFFRDVQEELQDENSVVREVTFEVLDVLVAAFPDVFSIQFLRKFLSGEEVWMDADYE